MRNSSPPRPRTIRALVPSRDGSLVLRSRQRGFTLLEILVAFVILSLALGTLYRIFGSGARSVVRAEQYAQAVELAQNLISEAGIDEKLQEGDSDGEFAAPFRWHRSVRRYELPREKSVEIASLAAFQVDVEVRWAEGASTRRVALSTLRLVPDPSLAAISR